MQSSPRPVSSKTSPSMPLVWVSRCRGVTVADTSSSSTAKSGNTSLTGASRSSLPSSTSCMISVAVHTLEMEPIWKIAVRGRAIARHDGQHAGRHVGDGAVPQDAERRARHLVLVDEFGQPSPPVRRVDLGGCGVGNREVLLRSHFRCLGVGHGQSFPPACRSSQSTMRSE